jgi:uncharacterized membrane protein
MTDVSFTKLVFSYFLTALVFFAIDILWLGVIAKGLYDRYLGALLAEQVNWTAAIIFYFIFILGIFIFAILPAVEKENMQHALLYGVLFGFFTYATYDFTNWATLKDWPYQLVAIDILWGMFLTGSVATSGYYITRWLSKS